MEGKSTINIFVYGSHIEVGALGILSTEAIRLLPKFNMVILTLPNDIMPDNINCDKLIFIWQSFLK